ncbi:DUF5776 domain-containing protein [Levilactobacillus cerevisiae]|uniref:DUF5776 domain-containing protein n=1 Tax=Levilactobacillus cerevisiae TaxID=1704076 RepID=UPI00345E40AB
MKWRIGLGLVALGVVLGLSPLIGLGTNYVPVTPVNLVTAQADDLPSSGTMYDDVTWTLKDGVLTLGGGSLDPGTFIIATTPSSTQGQLLTDLAWSVGGYNQGLNAPYYQAFQNAITSVKFTGKLTSSSANLAYLFADLSNVTSFSGLDNLDVTNATDLTGLFTNDPHLVSIKLPALSANSSHSLTSMFSGDSDLRYADLSSLDNANVTGYQQMFAYAGNLETVNLANWPVPVSASQTAGFLFSTPKLQNVTFSPNMRLKAGNIFTSSGLTNNALAASTEKYDGMWISVGTGKVNFVNSDPLQGYRNYDPHGTVYSNADLIALYGSDSTAPTTNETYVWNPTAAGIITTPDPVIPTPTPTPAPDTTTTEEDQAVFQPFSVSATQKIGLYSSKNFTAANRVAWYAQKPQMKQPTFLVTGTATTKNGTARYQVRDTNRNASTYGQTGYITTSADAVTSTYYQNAPQTVTVINPTGINGYNNATLTRPITAYPQGKQLKVTAVVTKGLTTRFQLANGTYISANKQLVIAGKYAVPAKVRAKTAVNRYGTVNLTQKNKHYRQKAHQVFTVLGWDYSRGTSTTTTGTLRYRVAGGYITANSKYVTRVK